MFRGKGRKMTSEENRDEVKAAPPGDVTENLQDTQQIRKAPKKKKKGLGIFHNLGWKIGSLVFAVILWVLVTNINDPISEMRISNLQVKLLNTNLITDNNEVYTVLDNTDVVPTVTVRARRSILDSLNTTDIVATADVSDITSLADLDTIDIKYYSTKYNDNIEEIDGSIDNVKLSIEARQTKTLTLTTQTTGDVADGYQVGSITPEQNQVRISGPASVVSQIASAVATVDISDAASTISTYSDIRLFDADGDAISTENLTMNINSVKVTITILPVTEIPITAQYSGTPADGYMLNGQMTIDPSSVELAGKSTILSTVQSIVIPPAELDITGATDDVTKTVDITQYLPDGVTLADSSFDGKVTVTIGIDPAAATAVTATIDDLTLANVPTGYSAEITSVTDTAAGTTYTGSRAFALTFSGLSEDVSTITLSNLNLTVDLDTALSQVDQSGDLSGTYAVNITCTVPENVTEENTLTATVVLKSPALQQAEEEAAAAESSAAAEADQEENTEETTQ